MWRLMFHTLYHIYCTKSQNNLLLQIDFTITHTSLSQLPYLQSSPSLQYDITHNLFDVGWGIGAPTKRLINCACAPFKFKSISITILQNAPPLSHSSLHFPHFQPLRIPKKHSFLKISMRSQLHTY